MASCVHIRASSSAVRVDGLHGLHFCSALHRGLDLGASALHPRLGLLGSGLSQFSVSFRPFKPAADRSINMQNRSKSSHSRAPRGAEPRHLLCSEVAAPAACLSGEMEIRRRTKAPRGPPRPRPPSGGVAGDHRDSRPWLGRPCERPEIGSRAGAWGAVHLRATHGSSLGRHS